MFGWWSGKKARPRASTDWRGAAPGGPGAAGSWKEVWKHILPGRVGSESHCLNRITWRAGEGAGHLVPPHGGEVEPAVTAGVGLQQPVLLQAAKVVV